MTGREPYCDDIGRLVDDFPDFRVIRDAAGCNARRRGPGAHPIGPVVDDVALDGLAAKMSELRAAAR